MGSYLRYEFINFRDAAYDDTDTDWNISIFKKITNDVCALYVAWARARQGYATECQCRATSRRYLTHGRRPLARAMVRIVLRAQPKAPAPILGQIFSWLTEPCDTP